MYRLITVCAAILLLTGAARAHNVDNHSNYRANLLDLTIDQQHEWNHQLDAHTGDLEAQTELVQFRHGFDPRFHRGFHPGFHRGFHPGFHRGFHPGFHRGFHPGFHRGFWGPQRGFGIHGPRGGGMWFRF